MNFDLLFKLVKLANHNNAEGEANSAARAACKMLSEDDYKWLKSVIKGNGNDSKGGTWNDVKRSTEPQWRAQRPYNRYEYDPFQDFWTGFEEAARKAKEEKERQAEERKARTGTDRNWYREYREPTSYEFTNKKGFKKVYIEKLRRCVSCGYDRMTTDETPAYTCAKCRGVSV